MSHKSVVHQHDGLYVGELELAVLLAVMRLGDHAYGVSVRDELERLLAREFSFGTIYKTLTRLEDKGYLTSREGEPSHERGGRRKKLYYLAPPGTRAAAQSVAGLRRLAHGLAKELEAV